MNQTAEPIIVYKAGVIGDPIAHSLSPVLHGFWLEKYGINGRYDPYHVTPDALSDFIQTLKNTHMRGCNVTLPHKEAVMAECDAISETAKHIGAVNTLILREDGALYGDNTDAYGFAENLRAGVDAAAGNITTYFSHAVILGAGGAARAALYALIEMGVMRITVVNRTLVRAQKLCDDFANIAQNTQLHAAEFSEIAAHLSDASMLINTTSLGMQNKAPLDISLESLPRTALVYDIVYTPLITPLLEQAQMRGNLIIDGLGMLLHQAVQGFEAWFGVRPEVDEALRNHLLEHLVID